MAGVFQNAAMVLSMGIFFTLMISGIASILPGSLYRGLVAQHVPAATAAAVSHLPPITSLFASLLGYNPMAQLLGPSVLSHLPAHSAQVLAGRSFFPSLLATPFGDGLTLAFTFGAVACALAALASALRGKRYVHAGVGTTTADAATPLAPATNGVLAADRQGGDAPAGAGTGGGDAPAGAGPGGGDAAVGAGPGQAGDGTARAAGGGR